MDVTVTVPLRCKTRTSSFGYGTQDFHGSAVECFFGQIVSLFCRRHNLTNRMLLVTSREHFRVEPAVPGLFVDQSLPG